MIYLRVRIVLHCIYKYMEQQNWANYSSICEYMHDIAVDCQWNTMCPSSYLERRIGRSTFATGIENVGTVEDPDRREKVLRKKMGSMKLEHPDASELEPPVAFEERPRKLLDSEQ